jgi:hypothetical protein
VLPIIALSGINHYTNKCFIIFETIGAQPLSVQGTLPICIKKNCIQIELFVTEGAPCLVQKNHHFTRSAQQLQLHDIIQVTNIKITKPAKDSFCSYLKKKFCCKYICKLESITRNAAAQKFLAKSYNYFMFCDRMNAVTAGLFPSLWETKLNILMINTTLYSKLGALSLYCSSGLHLVFLLLWQHFYDYCHYHGSSDKFSDIYLYHLLDTKLVISVICTGFLDGCNK